MILCPACHVEKRVKSKLTEAHLPPIHRSCQMLTSE